MPATVDIDAALLRTGERSPAEVLALMDPDERRAWVERQDVDDIETMMRRWEFWSRPAQRAPTTYFRWWLAQGGRGSGKTRSGAEWILDRAEQHHAAGVKHHAGGLMSRTFGDVIRTMVDGASGLEACAERRGYKVRWARTSPEVEIPKLRTTFEVRSADQPEGARGRNWSTVWMEELASWRQKVDEQGGTAFTNADLSLRIDAPNLTPAGVITTTPRAIMLMRDLVAGEYGSTVVTRSTLFDNIAHLAPEFVEAVIKRYLGTRLGLQEIMGVLLDDVEGALWTAAMIEAGRVLSHPALLSPIVAVDPPGEKYGAECGIIVVATNRDAQTVDDRHAYVLDDCSMAGAPEAWAAQAVATVRKWGASKIVAEVNNGHDMVRAVIHAVDPTIIVDKVHASKGKLIRAEPVATLYDLKSTLLDADGAQIRRPRVHHVGQFGDLEGQMTTWVEGDDSPDRLDALVWGITELLPYITVPPTQHTAPGSMPRRLQTGAASHMRTR